jgi:hypothetical protein
MQRHGPTPGGAPRVHHHATPAPGRTAGTPARTERPPAGAQARSALTTIVVEGRPIAVSVQVGHDGIEYVGRLWFVDGESADPELTDGIPDRAALPGRTPGEVRRYALGIPPDSLARRYARAMSERRRYRALRHTTEELLERVRYMNRVALLVRDGLLDVPAAVRQLDRTEAELHDLVVGLRANAGRRG